ncbi:MAG: hypothetical protein ACR2QC_05620, partial [Gammaproteobacteria bacterium]
MKTTAPPPPCVALFWRIFCVFAVLLAAAAANARPVCADVERFNFEQSPAGPFCDDLQPAANVPTNVPHTDADGVRAAFGVLGSGSFIDGIPHVVGEALLIIANRSGTDITYSPGDTGIFYPQNTLFPPLPLANLKTEVVVADGQQEVLVFENLQPPYSSRPAGTASNTGYPYFSQQADLLVCVAGTALNTLLNSCDGTPTATPDPNPDPNPPAETADSAPAPGGDSNARDLA